MNSTHTLRRYRLPLLVLLLAPVIAWISFRHWPIAPVSEAGETGYSVEEDSRPAPTLRPLRRDSTAGERSAVGTESAVVDRDPPTETGVASPSELVGDNELWELVAELEALAENPGSFHARALPVVDRLSEVCSARLKESDRVAGKGGVNDDPLSQPAPDERAILDELVIEVVRSGERSALVRGAVLLAVSTLLDEGAFRVSFDACFRESGTPPELLRAAALAATRRGSESSCPYPLTLAKLADLPSDGSVELPGFYALRLDRIVEPYEAEVLRSWLMAGDPRRSYFVRSPDSQALALDVEDLGEFFVTCELLFAVWGQRALLDVDVEESVVHEALLEEEHKWSPSLIYFRVASFLVHALAPCSDRLSEVSERMKSSQNPDLASMAELMEGMGTAGSSSALAAKIEKSRYAPDAVGQGELVLALMKAGDDLELLASADPELCEEFCLYLDGIVQDPVVTESGRATALTALARSGLANAIDESSARVLRSFGPDTLAAIAIQNLMQGARTDESRRARVLEIFEEVMEGESRGWLLSDLEKCISELSP